MLKHKRVDDCRETRKMRNSLVSCVLGFMVITQYKMTQDNIQENIRLQRTGDLVAQLKDAEHERMLC